MASDKEILFEARNHVGFVTLNRPAVLNALSYAMILEMHAQLRQWAQDASIYAIVVKGAGSKAFCAGGDVRAVHASFTPSSSAHRDFFASEYRLDYFIHRYPKPYIALLDGIVMGGGMGIAQGASLRVVTDRTRMAMPEVGIGFFPDVGASYFLSRLPGALGAYLGLSGVPIRARDALYAGLADVYLPHETLDTLDSTLATLRWTPDYAAAIHDAVRALGAAKPRESTLAGLRPVIDAHFSHSDVRAIPQSLQSESDPAHEEWARQTLEMMAKRSPLMMAVTARQLERGRAMDLADCFRMELGMVLHCFEQGDFREGVRALLVDKDNAPRWNPSRIEDVTEEMIAAFFLDAWAGSTHPLADLEIEGSIVDPLQRLRIKASDGPQEKR
jgi:enoyl-CoA hydratase/carnithine racemase